MTEQRCIHFPECVRYAEMTVDPSAVDCDDCPARKTEEDTP